MFDEISKLQIDKIYSPKKKVLAYKCPSCGTLAYPAVLRCKKCNTRRYPEDETEYVWHKKGYESWTTVPLEGPCKLITWTRLWSLPEGFDERFIDFAIVEFENGLRALGHLRVENPDLGMKLNGQAEKLREIEGEDFYGLVFTALP